MPSSPPPVGLGTEAPDFSLPAVDGDRVSLRDFDRAPALLVAFLCNHCPYVRHVERGFAGLVGEYLARGVAIVGICSNDSDAYPDDGPDGLRQQVERAGFTFPYLVDDSQEVARAYRAVCTPDFFVFNAERRLAYRGQMDASRPGSALPVTGDALRAALDAVLAGERAPADQRPPVGCSIKWRPGNAPGLP